MRSILLHKQIRDFRLSKNWQQKELAQKIGISARLLSNFELGISFPDAKYIAALNTLGGNIRPSFLAPVLQKVSLVIRQKMTTLKRTEPNFLEGIRISKKERLWIQAQMLKKNLRHRDVAEKAGCSRANVTSAMRGKVKSERVQLALAEVLGYPNFEAMIAAYRGKPHRGPERSEV